MKVFNILRAYEQKFGPNLGCTTENPFKFWQIPLAAKELNHAATGLRLGISVGDLKSDGREA